MIPLDRMRGLIIELVLNSDDADLLDFVYKLLIYES